MGSPGAARRDPSASAASSEAGIVVPLLEKAGANVPQIRSMLESELRRLPQQQGGSLGATRAHVLDVRDELSTAFILPALHRRGPITVAVSTAGASPALAQHLRDRFAGQVGFEHEQLAYELRRIRPWVKQNFHTYAERREYFQERVAKALTAVGSTEPEP